MFVEWLKKNRDSITSFNKNIFPDINNRSKWENISSDLKDLLLKVAENYKDYDWPIAKAYNYRRFQIDGDRLSYEVNHFERRRALQSLVLAQCILGKEDETYKPDILNGIMAICEESYWGASAHNTSSDYKEPHLMLIPDRLHPNIDLFSAETGSLLSWTMYLLGDTFGEVSTPLWERVRFEIKDRILDQFLGDNYYWWMGLNGSFVNNWNPWITGNIVSCIILSSQDDDAIYRGMWKSFYVLDNYYNAMPDDGGCDEGVSYWFSAGNALFQALYTWYHATNGVINFFDDEKIKKIGHYIVTAHVADNCFLNFADGNHTYKLNPFYITLFGKYIKDNEMISLGKMLSKKYDKTRLANGSRAKGTIELRFYLKSILEELFEEIPDIAEEVSHDIEMILPDLQMAQIRQNKDSKGFVIGAKGGNNDESHNHNDVGSLIAYFNGEPLLIDPGVETYSAKTFSAQRYDIWTMQSAWHNLPTINGEMQKFGKEFCAEDFKVIKEENNSLIEVSFGSAYPNSTSLEKLNRKILLDRENQAFCLTDEFEFSKAENIVEEHFMTVIKPEICGNKVILRTEDEREVCLECTNDFVKINVEERMITDTKLKNEWGDIMYRITYTISAPNSANFNLKIS